MDEAILYDLIFEKTIFKWYDEAKNEECTMKGWVQKDRDLLFAALDGDKRDLVKSFEHSIICYYDYIHFNVDVKLINICIKIGMEIQKFYDKFNEE